MSLVETIDIYYSVSVRGEGRGRTHECRILTVIRPLSFVKDQNDNRLTSTISLHEGTSYYEEIRLK